MLLVLAVAAAGLAALVVADRLTDRTAVAHRLAEAAARGQLGDRSAMERDLGFVQSYFSECIGLSTAASSIAGRPENSVRSRVVLWTPGTNICDAAIRAAADPSGTTWFDYSRYWHGYRTLVFPVVAAAGLRGAQALAGALLVLALISFFVLLIPVCGAAGSLAGFIVLVGLSGLPLVYVTPTHALSLAVILAGGAAVLRAFPRRDEAALRLLAVGLGAGLNFFDLLYNPGTLALTVGGSYLLAVGRKREPTSADATSAALLAIAALAGYGAMWVAKWLIGMPFYVFGTADFPILPADFGRWAAGSSRAYAPLLATAHLLSVTFRGPVSIALALAGATIVFACAWRAPAEAGRRLAAMGAPIAVGLLTIEGLAAHSIAHGPFTFRIVPFAAAFLVLAAAQAFLKRK